MLTIIRKKTDEKTLQLVSQDLKGYIKVVVDIDRNLLAAGGERLVDGEQLLLSDGSKQEFLWGGGLHLETNEVDFDSMINIRPGQNNSREILDPKIREKTEALIRQLLR